MTIYLIRHAQAGSRAEFAHPDDTIRPLTEEGRHQAASLVTTLGEVGICAVLTSPYKRCVQTAVPLAAHLGMDVELSDALAEGPHDDAVTLVRARFRDDLALVSHGDIIPGVLATLQAEDGLDLGANPRCQKGSVWILEPGKHEGTFSSASYVGPPRWMMRG